MAIRIEIAMSTAMCHPPKITTYRFLFLSGLKAADSRMPAEEMVCTVYPHYLEDSQLLLTAKVLQRLPHSQLKLYPCMHSN